MPKFEQEVIKGTGLIKLKTIEKDGKYLTNADYDFNELNTEGVITQLKTIIAELNKDLCSQGRTCEECGELIPNHFGNDLCEKCYEKTVKATDTENAVSGEKPKTETPKHEGIKKVDYGTADVNPLE